MRGLLSLLLPLCYAGAWVDDVALRRETEQRVAGKAKHIVVDLDKAPRDRWAELGQDPLFKNYKQDFLTYIKSFVPQAALELIVPIARDLKGKFYPDYADEMLGLAEFLEVDVGDIVLANLIYQVEGLGVKCEKRNTTGPCPPKRTSGPGLCTGVVASLTMEGGIQEVWQGRNLDWNLDASLLKYVLTVDYRRGNRTVFTGVQIAGQVGVLHGVRPGAFSAQLNARDMGGNVLHNLMEILRGGIKTPTHLLRAALENETSFAAGVGVLSNEPIVNPCYFVVAGVQPHEGVIVTRDGKGLADAWYLYEAPVNDTQGIDQQPDWFRVQTNYDHWKPVPDYDNRRTPAVNNMIHECGGVVNHTCLKTVVTSWPSKNFHTDVTSIMCPKTGYLDVSVWLPSVQGTLLV